MSAPGPDFAKQKELASKKHADLHDHEKMYLMRREIDHLRSVIRSQNDGSLKSAKKESSSISTTSASTSGSSSMSRAPVLTLFLFVGLLVIAIWKRRQRHSNSIGSTRSRRNNNNEEEVMTFELQDSLAGYEAPPTRGQTFSMVVAHGQEEEAQTIRI